MLHKILKYGTVFVVVLCLAITPVLTASADSNTFTFDFSKPECSERYGYFEILTLKNGELTPYLFLYSLDIGLTGNTDILDIQSIAYVLEINSSNFVFRVFSYGDVDEYGFDFNLYRVSSAGVSGLFNSVNGSFNYSVSSETIVGYHFYGNIDVRSSLTYSRPFNIVYSGQVDSDMLFTLLDAIYSNSGLTAETLANIETLLNSLNDERLYDIWELIDNIDTESSNISSLLDGYFSQLYEYDIFSWYDEIWWNTIFIQDIESWLDSIYTFMDVQILPLLDHYVSLQEDLITQPPASSSDLSDSIQSNPPREDGKDIVGELDSAQNEALGGKTPEDVKQDIEDTLDSDKLKEEISEEEEIEFEDIELEDITIVNQNVFNVVFDAFGGKWASYVVLTLSLAFAAFVIGRRF